MNRHLLLLALASAILLPFSLPNELLPSGATLPGLVGLVPVFLMVYRSPSLKVACRYGLLFGVVSTLIGNYWLAFFGEFSFWTISGVILVYAVYNYILFGVLFVVVKGGDGFSSALRPLWIATVWTGYEYLKSVGFLGYPWGLIAYPLARINTIAQIAEITGTCGLTFLAVYLNASLTELVVRRETGVALPANGGGLGKYDKTRRFAVRHLLAVILMLLVAAGFGWWRVSTLRPIGEVTFLLVQQNLDSWNPDTLSSSLGRIQELTLQGLEATRTPVDAVVWSETSLRYPYSEDSQLFLTTPDSMPFTEFLGQIQVPLITGAPMPSESVGLQETGMMNSAILILSNGRLRGVYAKQHLVPGAERLPFRADSPILKIVEKALGLGPTWVPGRGVNNLELPLSGGEVITLGTPICFEDSFGRISREMVNSGADLLVNLTNNSWSRQESAQTQHFAASRLRTIELRSSLVRSTNSGLSTVVNATGVASQTLPMFEAYSRVVTVPLYGRQWTLYKLLGDWLGFLTVGLSVFVIFAQRVSR